MLSQQRSKKRLLTWCGVATVKIKIRTAILILRFQNQPGPLINGSRILFICGTPSPSLQQIGYDPAELAARRCAPFSECVLMRGTRSFLAKLGG